MNIISLYLRVLVVKKKRRRLRKVTSGSARI